MLQVKLPIAIIGHGISGKAAKKMLLTAGVDSSDILCFDHKASRETTTSVEEIIRFNPKTLVVSPGFPLQTPWIQDFKKKGIEITSELSLALQVLRKEKIIAITGSLGKSTVVKLLEAGAGSAGEKAFVGGNIGVPLAVYADALLQKTTDPVDWIVLELSSFQLENCALLAPQFSGFTHFAPNHLERYTDLQHYYDTKWKLAKKTTQTIFYSCPGGDLEEYIAKQDTSHKSLQKVTLKDSPISVEQLSKAKLLGEHNKINIALAASIAEAAAWKNYQQGMLEFTGLPHRLENIGTFQGIRIINDSKATNLTSVATALAATIETSKGNVFLLLGGQDKNLPWEEVNKWSLEKTKIILFGEARATIAAKFHGAQASFVNLKEALKHAFVAARADDTVLLSPGGTSYDEFKNFEERGQFFVDYARKTLQKL